MICMHINGVNEFQDRIYEPLDQLETESSKLYIVFVYQSLCFVCNVKMAVLINL